MKDNIESLVKQCIGKEFLHGKSTVENDTPIIQDGTIDSLGIFVLVDFVQKEFGIKVPPEDVTLANFESVNAIRKLVESKLAATERSSSET